jgi:hypothetical protein
MSLHKLTAGYGYDYLTRQVAALDATEKGHTGLASYYTEQGESSGGGVDRLQLPSDDKSITYQRH